MKQFLFLVAFLAFGKSNAQTPLRKSMAIVQKCTATWCGPCGSWGWTLQEDVMADNMPANNPSAFVFALYGSSTSNYYNAAAGELTKWGQSFPNWGVNNINRTEFSPSGGIYTSTTRATIKRVVDSFALIDPVASTGFIYSITGNVITVNTKTQFWNAANGTFNLAVYVIEDSVWGTQNGQSGNVYHHNVLRGNMGASIYGDQIATGTVAANQTFSKTLTFTITDNTWVKSRMKILTVLWKKNGVNWDFVNANSIKSFATSVSNLQAVEHLLVYPNPSSKRLTVAGNMLSDAPTILRLIDVQGRIAIQQLARNENGRLLETLDISELTQGVYSLRIDCNEAHTEQTVMIVR
ncbi:MAG: Omp28-related outer membrane protein [Bacteroidetes bacterium]|nr:Omp28-related outer membrane protein [Bacteroidota bacterium]